MARCGQRGLRLGDSIRGCSQSMHRVVHGKIVTAQIAENFVDLPVGGAFRQVFEHAGKGWMQARYLMVLLVSGTAAFAHQGVQNASVKARMDGMSAMARDVEILARMAKGEMAFDGADARSAAEALSVEAARIAERFADREDDPKSEALPVIWDEFDRFAGIAEALSEDAGALAASLEGRHDLGPALREIGQGCTGCHRAYREER